MSKNMKYYIRIEKTNRILYLIKSGGGTGPVKPGNPLV